MSTKSLNYIKNRFKPLHFACSLLGISLFNHLKSNWPRWMHMIYGLILFLVFLSSFFYRIANVPPKFCQANAVGHSVIGIQQILSTFVITVIYYQYFSCRTSFQNTLMLMTDIDALFRSLNIHFIDDRFTVKILFEVGLIVCLIGGSFLFFLFHYRIQDAFSGFIEFFVSINPLLVINLNLLMFINLAWCVRDKFGALKRFLFDVCAIDSVTSFDTDGIWKVKLIQEAPHGLYNQLTKIAQIYERLYETVNELNSIFGLSNLTSMGSLENLYFFQDSPVAWVIDYVIFFLQLCLAFL